ncbi:Phosphotyrosyl phosphatase activator, partial [Pisolithus tinctorius]
MHNLRSTKTTPYCHSCLDMLSKELQPKAVHDNEVVDEFANDYTYFACIKFINSIKAASLGWHSHMLDDVSAIKTWEKVSAGMTKMYAAEVLGNLPVIQH